MSNFGEAVHREWRPMGAPRWIELTLDERAYWDSIARAAERVIVLPNEEFFCPDCDDYRDQISDLEDEVSDREEEIDRLELRIKRAHDFLQGAIPSRTTPPT